VRSNYSIMRIGFIPVSAAGGPRPAVGGYLRYIQFREQGRERDGVAGVDAVVRYLAHRDRSARGGGIFTAGGDATSADRKQLVDFIARSTKGLSPRWVRGRDGKLEDHQRAAYQIMISPDDAHGLDLRRITRVAMMQLESDAGGSGIGPWFAAEHRNTAHRHVQLVLPARREVSPGVYMTLIITGPRLQRMKEAMLIEIARQRGRELESASSQSLAPQKPATRVATPPPRRHRTTWRPIDKRQLRAGLLSVHAMRWQARHRPSGHVVGEALLRVRGAAIRYRIQIERELERQASGVGRDGWER